MSEQEVQNEILHYLNIQKDVFAWRANSTGIWDPIRKIYKKKVGFDIKGVSDIIGILSPYGVMMAIEVKSQTGKLRLEQKGFLLKINSMGGASCCARSLDEVILFLKELKERCGNGLAR